MDGADPTPLESLNVQVLQAAASGANLADMLDESEAARIGSEAVRLYKLDKASMGEWLDQMKRALDLAKLVKKDKTYPWKNAANVKYPLVTTAALQFNARAYPAIVAPDQIVKVTTFGSDPMGQKAARADRIAAHMSWQLTNRMEEWEEETDKLLVQLPIIGTVIRKVWFDTERGAPRTRVLVPGTFIVNDRVKALGDAPRCTEELSLYPDEIETRKRNGFFRDVDYIDGDGDDDQEPEEFIEQHCRLDLDGDGYEEPYIVTVHCETQKVARIVGDFTQADIRLGQTGVTSIRRNSYFVPYHFLPSLDGGFFGTGLGLLLGDTSDTINSIINMMMDAGHMASLGGGFIGSDFRIKGGASRFQPGEWKTPSASGAVIKDSIVPLTFPGPDATLFQLLGLLIDGAKDVASVKDVLSGDTGGRAMTATTTMALIEQGLAQFTAAYKRIFRSLRQEYKLIARINAGTVDPREYNLFHDVTGPNGQPVMLDPRAEYGAEDMDICPVADPRAVTKMQEAAKAQALMEAAQAGLVNPAAAAQRYLEALNIADVEELIPQPDPMQQAMAQMGMEAAKTDLVQKRVDIEKGLAEIAKLKADATETMAGIELDQRAQSLDAMKMMLEDRRERLDQLLTERLGRMAGSSGGQGGQGRA